MVKERKPVRFAKWHPSKRDRFVGYSYVVAAGPNGARKITPGVDRWSRVKMRMASSALATGVEEFQAWGGIAGGRWERTVVVSQVEAENYFVDCIEAGNFMLKGMYRRAVMARERRLEREAALS